MVEIDRFEKVQALMYTQCPDCSTAFRVTAEVLKQAAGKVRCGGCGNAFNALDYLSESMPEQPTVKTPEEALPELKPEPLQREDGLPASISAEQSAALLKTLDQLAGSNIRIEDTGVEWRVLDDDELGEAADDRVANADFTTQSVAGETEVDELLEESPTPVDQFLTETPPQVDSPEIFSEEANEPAITPVDELRFDDNTPLPEDFDFDLAFTRNEPEVSPTEPPEPEMAVEGIEDETQADLELSDPDEWTDILDEFEDLAEAVSAPMDSDFDTALDSLSEIEQDEEADDVVDAGDSIDEPLDMDTQFALQAEAMGIDLSGMHEAVEEPESAGELDIDEFLREGKDDDRELEELLEEDLVDEVDEEAPEGAMQLDLIDDDGDDETELVRDEEDELEAELDDRDDLEEDLSNDEGDLDNVDELDDELDDDLEYFDEEPDESEDDLEDDSEDLSGRDGHYVPPLTEEEQTINMQIDQDLMALAIEDDDGFASTMVLPEDAAEGKAQKEKAGKQKDAEQALKDTSAGFESIIMEGEYVRTALDQEKLAADAAAAAALAGAAAAERDADKKAREGNRRWRVIGGIAALLLLLVVQVLHQSRETLATIPAFNSVVGPMYRAIGKPLSPEWDITGWRFEVTKGSTDENDENLTIYSRIGNKSDKPLPYPIVAISLTDRFEETVGSRILDPADYLPNDLDPRKLVDPGNTFNAAITIQSPAEAATGFKLNVCYRGSGGQLRCAIDDFK